MPTLNALAESGYWARRRVSRRSTLRAAGFGLAGVVGAALVGCSGDDSTSTDATSTPSGAGAAASTAASTAGSGSEQPVSGGHLRFAAQADADTLDQLSAKSFRSVWPTAAVYSRLMQYDFGDGSAAPGTVSGDLAESWEQVDETTIALSLRSGVTWDEREPTSGRAFTAEDVVQSWQKFVSQSTYKADVANDANPVAPVGSMTAIDDETVEVKLAFPDATFFDLMAWPYYFWVHPVESMNGGFDPSSEMRGTGPWILRENKPAVGRVYDRNPKWYGGPDKPYLDSYEEVVIQDPAQAEAQFKSGSTQIGQQITTENLPLVASEVEGVEIYAGSPGTGGASFGFSWREGQPWHDERARRALAMSLDHEAMADVVLGADTLAAAGIDIHRYVNTPLGAGYGPYWLDPRGSDFGESAKYLTHNVEEARQLLSAAGFDDDHPLKFELAYATQYGAVHQRRAETAEAMARDAGIELILRPVDYTSEWVPNILRNQGDFGGSSNDIAAAGFWTNGGRSSSTDWLSGILHSGGANNLVGTNFPDLDSMIAQLHSTFDVDERIELTHEIQRYAAEWMPTVPAGVLIDTTTIAYTRVHGPGRYQTWGGGPINFGSPTETFPLYWMEEA